MAKIPDIQQMGRRPTPGAPGPVSVPRTDFTGEALQNISGAVKGFAEALNRKQERDDLYLVEHATNKLEEKMLGLRETYSNKKAADVAEDKSFYDDNVNSYNEAHEEISGKLKNDNQKEMFNRRGDVAKMRFGVQLTDHMTRETSAFQKQVYDGGIELESDSAIANYSNPAAVKGSLLRIEKLSEAEAERLGYKGDIKKMMIKNNKSSAHIGVIKQAISEQQTPYAKLWYEKNKKEISSKEHAGIERLLESSNIRGDSQEAVDSYMLKNLTETEAKEQARKITDPKLRDATIQRVTSRYGEEEQIRERNQRAAGDEAWDIYEREGLDAVPETLLNEMDAKDRISLKSHNLKSAKGPITTVPETFYKLQIMMGSDREKFNDENLLKYKHQLSIGDFKTFVKAQQDKDVGDISVTKNSILMQGLANAGHEPKNLKDTGTAGKEARAIMDRFTLEEKTAVRLKGSDLNKTELKKLVDGLTIEVLKDPDAWFQTGARPVAEAEIEGVPTDLIDEIAQALVNDGKLVTDEAIRNEYFDMVLDPRTDPRYPGPGGEIRTFDKHFTRRPEEKPSVEEVERLKALPFHKLDPWMQRAITHQ